MPDLIVSDADLERVQRLLASVADRVREVVTQLERLDHGMGVGGELAREFASFADAWGRAADRLGDDCATGARDLRAVLLTFQRADLALCEATTVPAGAARPGP